MALKARPLRLVVTGVESTGKTTLAKAIAQHFGFPLALEVARFDQAVRHGNLAKVGSLGALNGLFFAGKGNGRHADSWLSMVEVDGLF